MVVGRSDPSFTKARGNLLSILAREAVHDTCKHNKTPFSHIPTVLTVVSNSNSYNTHYMSQGVIWRDISRKTRTDQ
jgi:hypothetical protein